MKKEDNKICLTAGTETEYSYTAEMNCVIGLFQRKKFKLSPYKPYWIQTVCPLAMCLANLLFRMIKVSYLLHFCGRAFSANLWFQLFNAGSTYDQLLCDAGIKKILFRTETFSWLPRWYKHYVWQFCNPTGCSLELKICQFKNNPGNFISKKRVFFPFTVR